MSSDIERLRAFVSSGYFKNPGIAERSDAELQAAIDGAKAWIGGARWSWLIVAANYLRDGKYHP